MTSRAVKPGYSTKAIVTGFGCWPSLVAAVAPCASVLDILIPSLVASGPGRSQAAAALLQGAFLGWRAPGSRGLAGPARAGDEAGEVGGVVANEPQQGRAAGVLPSQAQEIQA